MPNKSKRLAVLVFLIPFLLSLVLKYNYIDFKTNASLGVGYSLTAESISREFNFNINEYYGAAGFDVFKYKDNWYTPYAPLNSAIVSIPLILSNGFIKIFDLRTTQNVDWINTLNSISAGLVNSITLSLISIFLYKILKEIYKIENEYLIIFSAIAASISTILFNYSVTFINHPLSSLFILLSFYKFKKRSLISSGLFVGLAFLAEFPTILISIIYTLILIFKKTKINKILSFITPIAISIIIIFLFNSLLFDNPLNFGEVVFHEYKKQTTASFSNNVFKGIYTGLLSPLKGLVWYFPPLIFSLYFMIKNFKKNKEDTFLILGYFVITLIFYAFWNDCWGSSPLGPRYFSSTIPLLMVPFVLWANKQKNSIYILIIWSGIYFLLTILNALDGLPNADFLECELNSFTYFKKVLNLILIKRDYLAPIIFKYVF